MRHSERMEAISKIMLRGVPALRQRQSGTSLGEQQKEGFMDTRNEIKSYIVREGMTMTELVEKLAEQYGWSASVPNLSGKLRRGSLRYQEAVELADALGYEIIWKRRGI